MNAPILHRGILAGLASAALFGVGTPLAKMLLGEVSPWLLAGLLYLGAGLGLLAWRIVTGAVGARVARSEIVWLAGAIVSGGMVGPALLMWGLAGMPASGASLLLNAEGVFTALIAWFVFKENFDRRIALGILLIVAGAAVLSWPRELAFGSLAPALAVAGACLAWGIDNNLTRKVSLSDATFIAMVKGLAAGATNTGIALLAGASLPGAAVLLASGGLGLLSYGVSLVLFVRALRLLGTARTGAYFSTAPFFGAGLAFLLGDALTPSLLVAGALMALGVWLHVTERHDHWHAHEPMAHEHEHVHDEHHQHEHAPGVDPREPHTHWHEHPGMAHAHEHYSDAHHRHRH